VIEVFPSLPQWEVDGNGFGSCMVVAFDIMSVEPSDSITGDLVTIFFLIRIVGGGFQAGSTRHVGLLYLPRVIMVMENLVE
jgi:hypothetical protein